MVDTPLSSDVIRNTFQSLILDGQRISVNLPLLEAVYDLNAEISAKFPAGWNNGMGQMGMNLYSRLHNEGYWCTPINSLAFGCTGGDGAHFSFLISDSSITDETPVIISVPDASGDTEGANIVLGRGFEEFVRLGLHCGYFSMAGFAFDAEGTIKHYARTDWYDPELWFPSDNHKLVAEFVSERLQLSPLYLTLDELIKLQSEFRPLMRFR